MKLVKWKDEFGTIISFQENERRFNMSFGGNLDLYWSIYSNNRANHHNFIITKENYGVYILFEKLFDDIENIRLFNEVDIPFYIENDEEKEEYLKKYKEKIEYEKSKYRLINWSNYNELYDKDNNVITWYSDETTKKVANILKIKKGKEFFQLEFYIQPYVEGYDRDFNSPNYIPIRFRNSGSLYDPFNIIFMRMYEKMKEVDDINDYGHQISIEEYLYSENNAKKLIR